MRAAPVFLVLLSACGSEPPRVDIERVKIEASLDAYIAAAIRFGRTAPADRVDAQAQMTREREYLRLLCTYPDGRKYVTLILARKLEERSSRAETLSAEERRLLVVRPPPEELGGIARERYDCELAASALEQLSAALSQ